MKIIYILFFAIFTLAQNESYAQYGIIHASTAATGDGSGKDQNNLALFNSALLGANKHIQLQSGSYTFTSALTISDNMTLEGGFIISGGEWVKTGASTTITITPAIENNGTVGYVRDMNDISRKGLNLKDLTILVNATNCGISQTYATPELKASEEKHIAEKNLRLGINATPMQIESNTIVEEKAPFEMNLLKNAYKFSKIEAIDFSSKHSQIELTEYTRQANEEYNNIIMAISNDLSTFYFVEKNNNKQYNIAPLFINNNIISIKDCKECQDHTYKIISQTDTEITLELKPQDEGKFFVYKLTLNK